LVEEGCAVMIASLGPVASRGAGIAVDVTAVLDSGLLVTERQ
jgi:hypothetical protein